MGNKENMNYLGPGAPITLQETRFGGKVPARHCVLGTAAWCRDHCTGFRKGGGLVGKEGVRGPQPGFASGVLLPGSERKAFISAQDNISYP